MVFEKIDTVFAPWESALKLPSGVTSRQWAPEAVAWLLELPQDMLLEPFGAKVSKALSGLILSLAPQWLLPYIAPGWATRDTEDMQGIAKHLLAEGLDPKPEDLVAIANAVRELREGITLGDWARIAKAFGAKPLEEIKAGIDRAVEAWKGAFAIPPAAPPAPPTPPLARETLASPQAPPPVIPGLVRMTSDTFQPPAPPIPKALFKTTLG